MNTQPTISPFCVYVDLIILLGNYAGWRFWIDTKYCPLSQKEIIAVKRLYKYCKFSGQQIEPHIKTSRLAIEKLRSARQSYNHWLITELIKIKERHAFLFDKYYTNSVINYYRGLSAIEDLAGKEGVQKQ